MINPTDLAKVNDMAQVLGVLPYLRHEIQGLCDQIDRRVAQDIADGALTPDKAFAFWVERHAYQSILRRFEQRARVGQAVGERLAPEMT